VLCAACGAVTPIGADRPPAAEPWMLEWQIREYRTALEEPIVPRRRILARGAGIVALAVGTIMTGVVLAFLAFGRVNYRYVGVLAALLTMVGAFAVVAVAWAAGDPNLPLKDQYRRRLAAAERALDLARDDDEDGTLSGDP
jgi:hypothetical protein